MDEVGARRARLRMARSPRPQSLPVVSRPLPEYGRGFSYPPPPSPPRARLAAVWKAWVQSGVVHYLSSLRRYLHQHEVPHRVLWGGTSQVGRGSTARAPSSETETKVTSRC